MHYAVVALFTPVTYPEPFPPTGRYVATIPLNGATAVVAEAKVQGVGTDIPQVAGLPHPRWRDIDQQGDETAHVPILGSGL